VTAIRTPSTKPVPGPDRHLRREIGEGLRFVLGNRLLRSIAMCTGTYNLCSHMILAVFYVLLARDLRVSAGVIGLISATGAVGGILGSLVATRFAAWVGQGPAIWISIAVTAPLTLVTPFVRHDWTLVLLAVAQVGIYLGTVVYNIIQVSFRQGVCPPELLGRMNATMRFLVWGTMPLGALLGGVLGATIGVRPTLLVAAIGSSLTFLPVFLSPLRHTRDLDPYGPVAAG
jgi:predicted MFS family arabinose efflux permease